ncbi:MAG: hypothetical protein ACYDH4_11445 [Candidatus Cryosericum sp.]
MAAKKRKKKAPVARGTWGIPPKVQAAAKKRRESARVVPRIRAPRGVTKGPSSFQKAVLAESKRREAEVKTSGPRKRKGVYIPPKPPPAWAWGRERDRVVPPEEVVFRGPRGRLLTKTELAKQKELYRVEREFAKKLKAEKEFRARTHPIPDERRRELVSTLKRLGKAMEEPNLDFQSVISTEFDGHAMHAKIELGGITSVKVDERMAVDQVNALVMSFIAKLKKQKLRRGLMVQLSFIPQESTYLQYGRDGDLMTTSWGLVSKSSEIEAFAPAAQRMVAAMIRNGWDITSLRAMFFYDQTVADGVVVKSNEPKRERRRR